MRAPAMTIKDLHYMLGIKVMDREFSTGDHFLLTPIYNTHFHRVSRLLSDFRPDPGWYVAIGQSGAAFAHPQIDRTHIEIESTASVRATLPTPLAGQYLTLMTYQHLLADADRIGLDDKTFDMLILQSHSITDDMRNEANNLGLGRALFPLLD